MSESSAGSMVVLFDLYIMCSTGLDNNHQIDRPPRDRIAYLLARFFADAFISLRTNHVVIASGVFFIWSFKTFPPIS